MLGFASTRPMTLAAAILLVAGTFVPASNAQQARTAASARPQVQWSPYRDDAVVQTSTPRPAQPNRRPQPASRQQPEPRLQPVLRHEVQATVEFEEPLEEDLQYEIGTGIEQQPRYAARPAAYDRRPTSNLAARPYSQNYAQPRMSHTVGQMHTQYVSGPEMMEELPGQAGMPIETYGYDGQPSYIDDGYAGGYGNGCGNNCGNACCNPCLPCLCLPQPNFCNFEVFAGTHGFTSSANRGGPGSFGFHQGVNWGTPLLCGFALQAGVQVTQSNFDESPLTDNNRTQTFVTLGGFRRVDCGLQGGLVIDYLSDSWDYNADLTQLRGELSWRFPCNHEIGVWFTSGTNQASSTARIGTPTDGRDVIIFGQQNVNLEATDLFAFFYRRQFCCGGEGRVFAGFSSSDQFLIGSEYSLPISPCFSLQTDCIYLNSSDDNNDGPNFVDESWNVSLSVVWTPFAARGCQPCGPNYCRPLFDVASNANFIPRLFVGNNNAN